MGSPSTNPYSSQPLQQNVNTAYNTALGATTGLPEAGAEAMEQGAGYAGQAGDVYGQMAGMTPQDVTAGQIGTTDLQPYMNPYTSEVLGNTLEEMNRQYGIQDLALEDQAMSRGAYGSDRMYQVMKPKLAEDFSRLKRDTIADAYMKNFLNAQQMGQFDIGAKMQADQGNQQTRAGMTQAGAGGLGQLGQLFANAGIDLSKTGISALGDLSNLGFGFGQSLLKNQLAAGSMQQQQQQDLIDAALGQISNYTGYPMSILSAFLGSIQNPSGYGTTTGKTTNDPGILGTAAGIAGILGAL